MRIDNIETEMKDAEKFTEFELAKDLKDFILTVKDVEFMNSSN